MPKLTFRTTREGHETPVELALQVRTADLAFVQSSVTGRSVDLKEGKYHVTAQFPGGQELTEFVEVPHETDIERTFDLARGGSELYRAASGYQSLFLSAATADPKLVPVRDVAARVVVATLGAAPAWDDKDGWPAHKPLPTHLEFAFRPHERKFVVAERSGREPVAVALPGYFLLPATVEFLTDTRTGRLVVKAHPFNRVADWLLGYLRAGTWGGAVALTDGLDSAADLVRHKREDPVAAAIGALVLLRAGRADDLRGWADLLDDYRPWFPDARIVRAECAARRGEHREAFELLAGLPANVTPMFADALGYALDRLGAYLHRPARFRIDMDLTAADDVLNRLCDLAARSDRSEPLLALEGANVPDLLVSSPAPGGRPNIRGGPTTVPVHSPPRVHSMSESTNGAHPNPFAGFAQPLGRLPLDRQIAKLKEIDAEDQVELLMRLERVGAGAALGPWQDFWRWLTETPAWKHTGMALGYLAPLDGATPATREIQDPGALAPDPTLKGQRLTLTLNRLRAANYPGSGTHRVLFTFSGRNQTAGATEEVAFNLTTRIKESESAAVLGLPIFIGLQLGAEGLLCTGQIVNVSNDDDERFLAGLESGPFKNGLRLLESLQPAIQPFTALAMGVAKALGDRNRNQPVYEFNLGLDFATTPGGARLHEGLYVVVQVPDEGRNRLTWADWMYTADNRIVHKTEPDKVLPLNYFALGVRRSASE